MAPTQSRSPSSRHAPPSLSDVCGTPTPIALGSLQRLIGAQAVPLPGSGATPRRFGLLADWAGQDLSLARLAEGHIDALAVRAEAGLGSAAPATTYGVWAARSPSHRTLAERRATGWVLSGAKEFCSGAGMLGRALVAAEAPDGYRMFDVDLSAPGISIEKGSWKAVGMAASMSTTVNFDRVEVAGADAVGDPGFYLGRPGFWFGGIGVAACWFGGARALVSRLLESTSSAPSPHVLADVGRAVAAVETMEAVLDRAAAAIDRDPDDQAGGARRLALATREAVHHHCVAVLELTARAGGARPLGHDPDQARRAADLYVYLSQHHGGGDAAELGRLALESRPC